MGPSSRHKKVNCGKKNGELKRTEGGQKTMKMRLHKDFPGGHTRSKSQVLNFRELQNRRLKRRIGPPSLGRACYNKSMSQNTEGYSGLITSMNDKPLPSGALGAG
jgi:hypothetical protein